MALNNHDSRHLDKSCERERSVVYGATSTIICGIFTLSCTSAADHASSKPIMSPLLVAPDSGLSEKGVRLVQKMQVGPGIPVRIQIKEAAVGPISGQTTSGQTFSLS